MPSQTPRSRRARRRLHPPIWDHHWAILAPLRRSIEGFLDTLAKPAPNDRVIDLGCGDSPYEPLFAKYSCEYIGCDLGDQATVRIEPGQPVPLPDGSASGVVSFQVLEHVWDLDWYLGECHRLLRSDGWLILSTHGSWLYHPHPHDFRRWTRPGLTRELTERGFTVETMTGILGPLGWTTLFRAIGIREVLLKLPLLGPLLIPFIVGFLNLKGWLEDRITPSRITQENASIYILFARKTAPVANLPPGA